MPLGHKLFGAQAALKHIDSIPALQGGGRRRPRVGYHQRQEELAGNGEEMNAQVPALSPLSIFFCSGMSHYSVFCIHKYDGVNRATRWSTT